MSQNEKRGNFHQIQPIVSEVLECPLRKSSKERCELWVTCGHDAESDLMATSCLLDRCEVGGLCVLGDEGVLTDFDRSAVNVVFCHCFPPIPDRSILNFVSIPFTSCFSSWRPWGTYKPV